ncbi:glycosyltransferase [Buchananella felis]|uniref:glycosyltransferase n=1 Tax=Buchananella felis TaxID=3231492 RepID=UPI0035296A1C
MSDQGSGARTPGPADGTGQLPGRGAERRRSFTLVSRIYAPEPAAACLRLAAVEAELSARGHRVRVLTSRPPRSDAVPGAGAAADPSAASGPSAAAGPAGVQGIAGVPGPAVVSGAAVAPGRAVVSGPALAPGRAVAPTPGAVEVSRWPVLRAADGQLRGYLPYLSFDLPLLARVLSRGRPGAFLVEPPPTTGAVMRVLAGLLGRPYVWYAADVWSDAAATAGAPRPVVAVVRALERFALRGAAHVVAVTDGVAQRVTQLGARAVSVVPNGVDTAIFTPHQDGPGRAELAAAGVVGPYLVYAGTASEWQGADVFVRAAALLNREVQLVFLGQGSAWPLLEELAAQLPPLPGGAPRVVLLGQLSPVEAAKWQAGASGALVSIVPGQGYDFAYPTKVLSALASGVPVLYAGVGPVRADLTDPLLGQAVAYDVAAVAAAMEHLGAGAAGESCGGTATGQTGEPNGGPNSGPGTGPTPGGCRGGRGKAATSATPQSEEAARASAQAAQEYRHQWVARHRSTAAVGRAVADILEAAARLP